MGPGGLVLPGPGRQRAIMHLHNQAGPSGCDPEHVWTGGGNPSLGTLCSHVSLRARGPGWPLFGKRLGAPVKRSGSRCGLLGILTSNQALEPSRPIPPFRGPVWPKASSVTIGLRAKPWP